MNEKVYTKRLRKVPQIQNSYHVAIFDQTACLLIEVATDSKSNKYSDRLTYTTLIESYNV